MALEAAYQALLRRLKDLAEAVKALELVLADRPVADDLKLVDQFEDAATELQGDVEESLAAVAPLTTLHPPALLEQARQHLPTQQATVNAMHRTLLMNLAGFDRLYSLRQAGHERGGEWDSWTREAQTTVERCRQPLFNVAQALLECWQEFAERAQLNTGVVQTTTIHQPIVVPEQTAIYMKGVKNS